MLNRTLSALRGASVRVRHATAVLWSRFRRLPRWGQALIIALVIGALILLGSLFGGKAPENASAERTVTLRSLAELSGNAAGASVVGNVRARSEAEVRAEAAGTVRAVNTAVGASVPAGFVLAELENDAERAQVTQAEGAYDAALAARAGVSPVEVDVVARNAYRDAFSSIDILLENDVDDFFGALTPYGPDLLINPKGTDPTRLSRERARLADMMSAWRTDLPQASAKDPGQLLTEAEGFAREVAAFVDELVENAYATGSDATPGQFAAAASAQSGVNGVLASLSAARSAFQSGSTSSTASVDASVKSALGTLRLAQAALEKTRLRAPIAGTVNFLPVRVGDYVANLDHVATVAQNGALEIVVFVSEEAAATLIKGAEVRIDDTLPGVITSVAPALDPVTKQVEVHVAVDGGTSLVNGQSVRVTLPGVASDNAGETGPVLLPLAAVKLTAGSRVVFTIGEDARLRALSVEIGDVVGERIEVLTPLPADLRVVEDARGLSDGQKVNVAED